MDETLAARREQQRHDRHRFATTASQLLADVYHNAGPAALPTVRLAMSPWTADVLRGDSPALARAGMVETDYGAVRVVEDDMLAYGHMRLLDDHTGTTSPPIARVGDMTPAQLHDAIMRAVRAALDEESEPGIEIVGEAVPERQE